jgi:hypothetical protein
MTDDLLTTVERYRADAQVARLDALKECDATQRDALFRNALALFQAAIILLNRGLRRVRRYDKGYTKDVCRLLESLSQTHGSLAGTFRDTGDLQEAICHYDQGNLYEEERRQHCAASDTYKMLQRVIVRLLAEPGLALDSALLAELNAVRAEIERQKDKGRNDSWVLADLALTRILCGVDADEVVARLEGRKAEPQFYESTHNTVKALVDKGLGGARLEAFQRMLQRKGGLR